MTKLCSGHVIPKIEVKMIVGGGGFGGRRNGDAHSF